MISDAHSGLRRAIATTLAGTAWQRCRVHLMRNLLARVPRGHTEMVAATIRTIFAQPDATSTRHQPRAVADTLGATHPDSDARYRLRFMQLTEVNDPAEPNFEGTDHVVTVEQIGGGPSWWVTAYAGHALAGRYEIVGQDLAVEAWEFYWVPTDNVWSWVDRYGLSG